jgi:ubiquinol-cytochrome c reductase cytochrome b subunit
MGAAVLILFVVPWLDKSKVKSIRYKGTLYKKWLTAFVVSFIFLGYLGTVPSNVWGQFSNLIPGIGGMDVATFVARVLTLIYFSFFVLMPWYSRVDKTKPVPKRVTYK